ncbi:hypothetical protein NEF87_004418 [Candidatus Lokiarchaeum ossiferum]|uniref:Lipoyl-binding domain-containing protein n=1 Tax=Candidatus Lokiarchaeum ossiferum TaxID=2951803 RepID=A0ABY6HX81_9ARCH|nr:hypothetical protein NEF87_004418 [Candidatus Lokiarchaeum sp. B-35]
MYYKFKHNDRIEQGDILFDIPKILPESLYTVGIDDEWNFYVDCLKTDKRPTVKFSVLPEPTMGVILTQTCNIENAKKGDFLVIGELKKIDIDYTSYEDFKKLTSNKQKERCIKAINHQIRDFIRNKPNDHFFPKINFPNGTKLGPFHLKFKTIFLIPTELVKNNLDIFWKARIIDHANVVLKDKIKNYFTRLAFDDCIFMDDSEFKIYRESLGDPEMQKILNESRKKYGFYLDEDT